VEFRFVRVAHRNGVARGERDHTQHIQQSWELYRKK
jgi:hypothetical protein